MEKNRKMILTKLLFAEGVLREARIILPRQDNNGVPLIPVKNVLEKKLLTSFGGFTRLEGMGGWESNRVMHTRRLYQEYVWIYDIVVSLDWMASIKLKRIGLWLKKVANQESIYLRLPSGEIEFL